MDDHLIGAVLFPTEYDTSRLQNIQSKLSLDKAYPSDELHITLGVGVMPFTGLKTAYEYLNVISMRYLPITLQCAEIKYHDGMVGLLVEKSEQLLGLHAAVMDLIFKSTRYNEITADMFYRDSTEDPIEEDTISWAQTFRKLYSFTLFNPHITLGTGREQEVLFNSAITIGPIVSLSLCQVGNHGIPGKALHTERSK